VTPEARFGVAVRAARTARGWSQDALADRLREGWGIDLSLHIVGRIELATRPTRLDEAVALASLLGLDLATFGKLDTPENEVGRLRIENAELRRRIDVARSALVDVETRAADGDATDAKPRVRWPHS